MKIFLQLVSIVLWTTCAITAHAQSEESKGSSPEEASSGLREETQLTYPELEVTPRASERLEMEAKRERRTRWVTHLPIQFSALMTLYAGSNVDHKDGLQGKDKDDFESAQNMAVGVGAGWLVLTGVLSATYQPYYRGWKETVRLPKKTKRDDLTRERLAEEALNAPARLATKLKWFSIATNLWASAQLLQNAEPESRMTVGIASVAAFAPLLFDYRWSQVATQHREYKKKIYGPVASTVLIPTPDFRHLQPALGLTWSF